VSHRLLVMGMDLCTGCACCFNACGDTAVGSAFRPAGGTGLLQLKLLLLLSAGFAWCFTACYGSYEDNTAANSALRVTLPLTAPSFAATVLITTNVQLTNCHVLRLSCLLCAAGVA
jgi:hypothetical protein